MDEHKQKSFKKINNFRSSNNRAFTVLELLVVIVIIAILATIAYLSWHGITGKAVGASVTSDLSSASQKLKLYQVDYNAFPTSSDCSVANPAPPKICLKFSPGTSYEYKPAPDYQSFTLIAVKNNVAYQVTDKTTPEPTTVPDVDQPSSPPVVGSSTAGNTTTFTWPAVTCTSGTPEYQYRYTINNGYDSGFVLTTNNSFSADTPNEGYTFTLEVQARCTTALKSSDWTSSSTTSYYRPITTPAAPTLSVAYSAPNAVATISPVTCVSGSTPQYDIRSRINDGTWSAYSAWGTTMTLSLATTQGVKYSFQAQARCHNSVSDSSYATTSEAAYTQPIASAPASTTASSSTSGSVTTFTWSAVTCSIGTVGYQYHYTITSGYDSGWVATTATSFAPTTSTEGYTYTLSVQARCSTAYTSSPWTTASTASYTRPKSMTATYSVSSTAQAQSTVQNLPGLVSVTGVSVNTGTVGYSLSGNNITLNVNNGTASQASGQTWNSTKYSSTKTSTYGPQSGTSFPSSISYNDGTYSGTLYYNNYTTNSSSSQSWNAYKYSKTGTGTVGPQASTSFPSSKSYNDGTYSGTIYYNNYATNSSSSQVWNATKYSKTLTNWVNTSVGSISASPVSTWSYSDSDGYAGTVYFSSYNYSTITGYHSYGTGDYYYCVGEGQTCYASGHIYAMYGVGSLWAGNDNHYGSINCDNATFGADPAPNQVKHCQISRNEGWYPDPPGTPIYNAMYSGTVYKGGYDTTYTYTYTGNYSGTVYQGGYDTTYTYTYTGNYSGTTYAGGYDTYYYNVYPYTITVNYLAI